MYLHISQKLKISPRFGTPLIACNTAFEVAETKFETQIPVKTHRPWIISVSFL